MSAEIGCKHCRLPAVVVSYSDDRAGDDPCHCGDGGDEERSDENGALSDGWLGRSEIVEDLDCDSNAEAGHHANGKFTASARCDGSAAYWRAVVSHARYWQRLHTTAEDSR